MAAKVLFVVTSTRAMGQSGKPTGLWLEEFTVPFFALRDAGHDIDVVSTKGGVVPLDPRSLEGDGERVPENMRFRAEYGITDILNLTEVVSEARFDTYSAIFLPGGHGTMWDLPECELLARVITALFTAGKPVAAVCHGPAGLVGAKLPDGRPLVAGRWVAAFTTDEEKVAGFLQVVPFLLDEKLAELGAQLVKGRPFITTAVADGNLITGQNPKSSREVAGMINAALRRQSVEQDRRDAA